MTFKGTMLTILSSVFIAFGSNTALAEPVQATVASVNAEDNSMTLTPTSMQQAGLNLPATLEVNNVDQGFFEQAQDINSLDQLSVGDEITVEANKNFLGNWNVEHIVQGPQQAGQAGQQQGLQQQQAGLEQTQAGQAGQQQQLDSPDMWLTGRVVAVNPENQQITVMDYATGYESVLTIVDQNVFETIREGDQVRVQQNPEGQQVQAGEEGQTGDQFGSEMQQQNISEQGIQTGEAGQQGLQQDMGEAGQQQGAEQGFDTQAGGGQQGQAGQAGTY